MAAQLMATNGPLARAESWWSERAMQLLARPALPEEEDGGVGGGRALDGDIIASFRAASSPMQARQADPLLVFLLQQDVFGEEPAALQGALEQEHAGARCPTGLVRKSVAPSLHRAHGVVDGARRRS